MVSPARADDVASATSTRAPGERYAYPIKDPYAATVLGTPPALRAAVPDQIDLDQRSITLFDARKIPKVLWSEKKFRYSLAAQKDRAPLIFLIAGTGARFNSGKNSYLQKVFYQAGMSVVNISSPTHPDFIVTASRSSVPGFMEADVQDLYTAMKRIWEDIGRKVDVSEFYIAGYSLGRNAVRVPRTSRREGEDLRLQEGSADQPDGEPESVRQQAGQPGPRKCSRRGVRAAEARR